MEKTDFEKARELEARAITLKKSAAWEEAQQAYLQAADHMNNVAVAANTAGETIIASMFQQDSDRYTEKAMHCLTLAIEASERTKVAEVY